MTFIYIKHGIKYITVSFILYRIQKIECLRQMLHINLSQGLEERSLYVNDIKYITFISKQMLNYICKIHVIEYLKKWHSAHIGI